MVAVGSAPGTIIALASTHEDAVALRQMTDTWSRPGSARSPRAYVLTVGTEPEAAARLNAEITALAPEQPVTVLAAGGAAAVLASVSLAQRAAHRRIREYLLVNPSDVPAGSDWPDAPVTVFSEGADRVWELRGWPVRPAGELIDWWEEAE